MQNKLTDLEAQLTDLNKERGEIEATIEQMIANMAEVPPEKRSASDWASDGALTRQFLDLTNRQTELETEIEAVSRVITAAKKPALPH
jgi:chromosome segregation ATPase